MPSRLIFSKDFFKSRLNLMFARIISVLSPEADRPCSPRCSL